VNPKKTDRIESIGQQVSEVDFDRAMDQVLGTEDEIVPSSGFLAVVMERVHEEAAITAAPTPIPFPWKRLIPGMALTIAVLGWFGYELVHLVALEEILPSLPLPEIPATAFQDLEAASWVVGALLMSLLSWLLSSRLTRRSGLL